MTLPWTIVADGPRTFTDLRRFVHEARHLALYATAEEPRWTGIMLTPDQYREILASVPGRYVEPGPLTVFGGMAVHTAPLGYPCPPLVLDARPAAAKPVDARR